MDEKQGRSVGQRRDAMPVVAVFVDLMRAAYGRELVDGLMVEAQRARREHADVLAAHGVRAAARWHRANAHRCTFYAQEAGRTLGLPSPWGQSIQTEA